MSLGTDIDAEVLSVIEEFGRTISYTLDAGTTYNADTSEVEATGTPKTFKAYVEPLTSNADGSIQLGDRRLTFAASSIAGHMPQITDVPFFDGRTYSMLPNGIETHWLGEDPVVHIVHVRAT